MRTRLAVLCLAYVLSQFFRAFLAVLSEPLGRDVGVTAEGLSFASGLWFVTFALMQLPVGWALDRIGPRRTASVLLALGGGGGAALFSVAQAPWQIDLAMVLIGVGCSPVLMASYYIFARQFPPARFATLAALMLGVGSVGNLVASYPMALAAEAVGWRVALIGLAAITLAVAAEIALTVRDPEPVAGDERGSVLDLLRMPVLWAILPLMFIAYAPPANIRGLWMGPYLADIHGLTTAQIGQATLLMGIAMIAGTLAYGPADRLAGSRKWVIFTGSSLATVALFGLAVAGNGSVALAVGLCAAVGFFGASYPMIIAHGRAFFPAHLAGRGVTLMNMFGIGGAGLFQFGSGKLHGAVAASAGLEAAYATLFAGLGVALLAGLAIYLFSRDTMG